MPGPVSKSYKGPGGNTPIVPTWMDDDLRREIAEIEARAKAQFEEAGKRLFGTGFTARHPKVDG